MRSIKLVLLPLLLAGCTNPFGNTLCTDQFVYGLSVTVVDAQTAAPPATAILLARSGSFADSVGPVSPSAYPNSASSLVLYTAGERAGTYDIAVRSPGYRDWTRSGIRVTADECHVQPVKVTAGLQR